MTCSRSSDQAHVIAILCIALIQIASAIQFAPNWQKDAAWPGPQWWPQPPYDWQQSGGGMITRALRGRQLSLLPYEVGPVASDGSFDAKVSIVFSDLPSSSRNGSKSGPIFAGFAFGRRGADSDFRSALINTAKAYYAFISSTGRVILFKERAEMPPPRAPPLATAAFPPGAIAADKPINLYLSLVRLNFNSVRVSFTVSVESGINPTSRTVSTTFVAENVLGGLSLTAEGPADKGFLGIASLVTYRGLELSGTMLKYFPGQIFGPILWTQYSISDDILRLQVQLAPVPPSIVRLYVRPEQTNTWIFASASKSDPLSRTALFVNRWKAYKNINVEYQARLSWGGQNAIWEGTIRQQPNNPKGKIRLGVFSCDAGYLFPQSQTVKQVTGQNPDVLAFLGDQLYEYMGSFPVVRYGPISKSMLDFLYKWYHFGWQWREVLKDRPSLILADDHDVFQNNLWGSNGKLLLNPTAQLWERGGYVMPVQWVNAVEKCYMGHLPPNPQKIVTPSGIVARFTNVRYGGVDFAILEDRKFKTGPLEIPPKLRSTGGNGALLGSDQETFLLNWARNWTGAVMKVALSGTIFAKASTHQESSGKIFRAKYSLDSAAWPKLAHDRVVRILGQYNVPSVHGDQHFGVFLKQGVAQYGDGGYAFMVPGLATDFLRGCWPGVSGQIQPSTVSKTGRFIDDMGNPLDVLGVTNPDYDGPIIDVKYGDSPVTMAVKRGSGYGMMVFDKANLAIEVALYRVGKSNALFNGFPISVKAGGRPTDFSNP